jgi:hypothetical protein
MVYVDQEYSKIEVVVIVSLLTYLLDRIILTR